MGREGERREAGLEAGRSGALSPAVGLSLGGQAGTVQAREADGEPWTGIDQGVSGGSLSLSAIMWLTRSTIRRIDNRSGDVDLMIAFGDLR